MGNSREKKIADTSTSLGQKAAETSDKLLGEQEADKGQILPKYNDLYANPMSSEEKGARFSGAAGPFDAARGSAEERVGRTRNAAGLNTMETKLALDKSAAYGKTAADIGDVETQRKFEALKGMSGIYGIDAQTLANQMKLGPEYLRVGADAAGKTGSGLAGPSIQAGGAIAGALIM